MFRTKIINGKFKFIGIDTDKKQYSLKSKIGVSLDVPLVRAMDIKKLSIICRENGYKYIDNI